MKYKWLIAGVIILALLGLCAGTILVTWAALAPLRSSTFQWEVFKTNAISAEADEEQRYTVSGATTLSVKNSSGDVVVKGGEGQEVVIAMHKTAWGDSEQEAKADLEALKVTIEQDGNTISVKVVEPQVVTIAGVGRSDSVDFTITVPKETFVTAETGSGDLSLSDVRGDAGLYNGYGGITVRDLEGELKADTSSGKITASNVQAGEFVIDLHSDYGKITLEHASAGDVTISSSSGEISLTDVGAGGDVSLESGYGRVAFDTGSAASLDAGSSSGEVSLTGLTISNTVAANSGYGDLKVKKVSAEAFELTTSSGSITVDGVSGSLKAESGYGSLDISNGELVTLDLHTNSGSIEYSGSLGDGPHTISSDYGSIQLTIPEDSTLTFDLATDYGKVKSDLPVTLSGDLDVKHWIGTINGGGAELTVSTNSGDIRIEILSK